MSSGLTYSSSKRKTIQLADVKNALKTEANTDVFIDSEAKYEIKDDKNSSHFDFPVAPFKRDVKDVLRGEVNFTSVRVSADAINGLMSFMTDFLVRYIRSAVGLDAHSDGKTVKARDLENVYTICSEFPKMKFTKSQQFPGPPEPTKKKKKKTKTNSTIAPKKHITASHSQITHSEPPINFQEAINEMKEESLAKKMYKKKKVKKNRHS